MGTITANAAYQQDGTRTHLKGEEVFWCKGDAIGVFAAGTPQVQFGLIKGEDTASGTFAGNKNYLTEGKAVYAYYPYTRGTTIDGTEVELEIMAEQTFRVEGTFDAAQAPAYAAIAKLEDKNAITFDFLGAASYLNFPVTGYGVLESLTLSLGDDQVLAGVGTIDVAGVDNPKTKDVDETPYLVIEQGESTVTVNCGGIVLNPNIPVNILFVVPTGVSFQNIELTAKLQGFEELVPANREIESTKAVTKRNIISTINADENGNAWSFQPEGYFVIDDAVAAYGLEGNDLAAMNFITYAYLAQEDTPAADSDDWKTVFNKLGEDAWMLKAVITAEEIDFEAFDAKAAFQTLGAYDTESKKYPEVTVYKNALTWYIENENAIESLYWGKNGIAVVGADPKNPAVINGLTILGNGITASAALENLKFTNSFVIVEDGAAGFVAAQSNENIKNVVLGAGNILNVADVDTSAPGNYIGGVFGKHNAGVALGVKVEELPTIVTPVGAPFSLRPSEDTPSMPMIYNIGKVFGQLYIGNSAEYAFALSLDDYKVTSLDDMPAIFHVTANTGNVLDITAKNVDATIDNVVAVNGDTETSALASIVINGVSYWNGTKYAPNNGKYFTAEELVYALHTSAADNIVLTHNIDLLSKEIENGIDHKEANVSKITTTETKESTAKNPIYNVFEIKNVKTAIYKSSEVAALFGNAEVSNVKLTNVVLDVPASFKSAAGVAVEGVITNVDVNGLTINIADKSKLTVVGGVLAVAEADDLVDVTVEGLTINNAGAETLKARAGIMAGQLNVSPKSEVNLNSIYANKATFTKVGEEQPKCSKGQLEYYTSNKNYGAALPFGTIYVENAGFATNGNVKAYLNAKGEFGSMTRLAAGIVFKNKLTNATTKVEYNEADVDKYNYVFISNAPIAQQKKIFGFYEKAE